MNEWSLHIYIYICISFYLVIPIWGNYPNEIAQEWREVYALGSIRASTIIVKNEEKSVCPPMCMSPDIL